MATLAQRLVRLEQQGTGDQGAGVWGIRTVDYATDTGPDVVAVPPTGETLTEAAFFRRYPRGTLIVCTDYGTPADAA